MQRREKIKQEVRRKTQGCHDAWARPSPGGRKPRSAAAAWRRQEELMRIIMRADGRLILAQESVDAEADDNGLW